MNFEMKPLPYAYDALEPHISKRTLEFHYDKHHSGYMKKLKAAIEGTKQEKMKLEELIASADGGVFNNAAQVWNHDFYWQSMSPDGGGEPEGDFAKAIERDFGDVDSLRERLKEAAAGHFGSGWAWLVTDRHGKLSVISTHDAGNPLRDGLIPLLTIDVWEHAYYLDVQNDRGAYLDAVIGSLINWQFAADNLAAAEAGKSPLRLVAG